jgi:hypothetical protein
MVQQVLVLARCWCVRHESTYETLLTAASVLCSKHKQILADACYLKCWLVRHDSLRGDGDKWQQMMYLTC